MQRVECGCPSQCCRSVIQIFTFSRDETRKLRSFTRFDNLQTVSCTHLISIVDCVEPRLAWSLPSCWFVLAPWRLDVNCCAVESNLILIETFFQGASLWNLANVWCPIGEHKARYRRYYLKFHGPRWRKNSAVRFDLALSYNELLHG